MNTQDSRPWRLGWGTFIAVAVMIIAVFGLITFLPGAGSRPVRIPMGLACASILGFFAFRWHVLRRQAFSGQLLPSEFRRDPRRHILGPRVPFIVWLVATISLVLGAVVLKALRQ